MCYLLKEGKLKAFENGIVHPGPGSYERQGWNQFNNNHNSEEPDHPVPVIGFCNMIAQSTGQSHGED